jgi:two-component system, response regulator
MTAAILLVEDNPADAEMTIDGLREAIPAVAIDWVKDGVQALDYLFGRGAWAVAPPPLPKVVLLDLRLPKVDGLQVLGAVRAEARTRRLPVVVLTSSREESDLVASTELGSNAYVVKPVDSENFHQAIRTLGLFWQDLNRTTGE